MPNFTVDWHSHNIPHWLRILERYRGQPDVHALEIGSFEGRSTVWLLENILSHATARIDCIDTFEGSVEHERMGLNLDNLLTRFLGNTEPYAKKVRCHKGKSQDVLRSPDFGPYEVESYDFIYIDGSHKAADVLEDAVLSFRLLKIGGLLIFDDYAWQGGGPTEFDNPRRGVEAFYSAYQNQLEPVQISYQAVFQRVAVQSRDRQESKPARLGMREMVNQLAS
jgi:predicted O-methyltransferase YrrM